MNFLVVGPGAMGCLFAAKLTRAGHAVTLLDYKQARADWMARKGVHVEGVSGEWTVSVPAVTGKPEAVPDTVLVCVKANKTREATQRIEPWLDPDTRVISLQNGVGNLQTLEAIFGKERVLGGITAEGATLLGPGHIRHAGMGDTIIGPEGGPGSPLPRIVSAFEEAGFKTRSAADVEDIIWGKLIVNVGINALTAITRLRNGRLPEVAGSRAVMEHAVREAVAVARARGISLPYPDPLGRVLEVCRATAENIASMLQDVLNRKATEVAYINGAVVKEGAALGIPTPVNETLTALVEAIQETYADRLTEQ